MNLHMSANFCANRPSRLVAFPEFVLRLVRLFAAVRDDSRKTTPKNNIYTSKIIITARTCRHQKHSGARQLSGRMPDSQSSEPGFESTFATVSKIGHFRSLH